MQHRLLYQLFLFLFGSLFSLAISFFVRPRRTTPDNKREQHYKYQPPHACDLFRTSWWAIIQQTTFLRCLSAAGTKFMIGTDQQCIGCGAVITSWAGVGCIEGTNWAVRSGWTWIASTLWSRAIGTFGTVLLLPAAFWAGRHSLTLVWAGQIVGAMFHQTIFIG